MISRRWVLASTLLLGAFMSAAVSSATGDTCDSGKAHGKWVLPSKGHPGKVHGALFDSTGTPVLFLGAHLFRHHVSDHSSSGLMIGHLRPPKDVKDGPRFLVFGKWAAGADGAGKFRAFVFKVHDGHHTDHAVGFIEGGFHDPPDKDAGSFHGQWKICH